MKLGDCKIPKVKNSNVQPLHQVDVNILTIKQDFVVQSFLLINFPCDMSELKKLPTVKKQNNQDIITRALAWVSIQMNLTHTKSTNTHLAKTCLSIQPM